MKERMQKTLAEVKGCPQKDRTESEGYVGAQTFMWICEDNIVEVPFDKEHLLERIISPDNLRKAYKAVQRNKGCSGIDKMSCEQMLPWLLANKDALIRSLLDGSYRPNPVKRVVCKEIPQVFRTNYLGLDSRKSLAACLAIPYSIHRRCRYQEPRYRFCLAYIIGAVDAYSQPNGNRLYPQMVVASHFPTYQHFIGERLFHQAFEVADVFL